MTLKNGGRVEHYQIKKDKNGRFFIPYGPPFDVKHKPNSFKSLAALVQHFKRAFV